MFIGHAKLRGRVMQPQTTDGVMVAITDGSDGDTNPRSLGRDDKIGGNVGFSLKNVTALIKADHKP